MPLNSLVKSPFCLLFYSEMTSLPSEATRLSSPSSGFARLAHASIIRKKFCFGIFSTFPSVFTFLSNKSLLLSLSNLDFSLRLSLISQLSLSLLRYPATGYRLTLPICKVICYLQGPPSFIGHCAFRFLGLMYTSLEANYVQGAHLTWLHWRSDGFA
nr:uncharacterized protein LOC103453468 [Malus domestica]